MSYTIYVLKHPISLKIRYVGATRTPLYERLNTHIADARYNVQGSPKVQWLRALEATGLRPIIQEIDFVASEDTRLVGDTESLWIRRLVAQGHKLLNVRAGGGGLRQQDSSLSQHNFSRWALDNLGRMPDTRIASHEGVSAVTVGNWRRRRNVPCYRGRFPPDPFRDPSVPVPVQIWNAIQIEKEIYREMGILAKLDWECWEARLVDWKKFYEVYSDPEGVRLAQKCDIFLKELLEDKERLRDEIVSLKG